MLTVTVFGKLILTMYTQNERYRNESVKQSNSLIKLKRANNSFLLWIEIVFIKHYIISPLY